MLKTIAIVTLVVRSLASVEPAYEEQLHYQAVERGRVSKELAGVWDTPAMAGRRYALLEPASGAPVYLRIIEAAPGTPAAKAFMTHGWNATELLVQDPDALATKLADTAFSVIGPPKNLSAGDDAPRAMQVLGPAGEALYMTRFLPGGSGLALGSAQTPVDRVFITVVGGPSLDELRAFWGGTLGLPLKEFGEWPIGVLSSAHGLPADSRFALAGAVLPRDFMVELDAYPPTARPRDRRPGALPGGWAMVSFTAERLSDIRAKWRSKPRALKASPYGGRRAAVTVGPAGEWIEVIEQGTPAAN